VGSLDSQGNRAVYSTLNADVYVPGDNVQCETDATCSGTRVSSMLVAGAEVCRYNFANVFNSYSFWMNYSHAIDPSVTAQTPVACNPECYNYLSSIYSSTVKSVTPSYCTGTSGNPKCQCCSTTTICTQYGCENQATSAQFQLPLKAAICALPAKHVLLVRPVLHLLPHAKHAVLDSTAVPGLFNARHARPPWSQQCLDNLRADTVDSDSTL
jgi:hypothetical protein